MVGKEPSNSIVFTTTNYSNRCIKEGTGSILPGSISGGTMEQIGPLIHINILDLNVVELAPKQVLSCSNGQCGGSHILSKNGRHQAELTNPMKKICSCPFYCRKQSQV